MYIFDLFPSLLYNSHDVISEQPCMKTSNTFSDQKILDPHFDLQNFSPSSAEFKSRGYKHDLHLFPLPYQSLNINNSADMALKNMQHRQGVFLYFPNFYYDSTCATKSIRR